MRIRTFSFYILALRAYKNVFLFSLYIIKIAKGVFKKKRGPPYLCVSSLFSQNSPGDAAPAFENICNSIEGGQISNKFCYDTLKDFPDINSADEHGIAVIAVELTLQKANATVVALFDLLNKAPKDDPKSIQPLQQCLQIYLALKTDLGTEIAEFVKTERYEAARIQFVHNTKQPPLCQAGSISKENADFSQLINLTANIIQYLEEN